MNKKLIKIMAFGDSNTYGPMIDPSDTYPSQLERKLISDGYSCKVFNKGINANTAKDGLDRININLHECQPQIVILHFGVADLKNGFSIKEIRDNLTNIIEICKMKKVKVILFGHKIPDLPQHRVELENLSAAININPEVLPSFCDMYTELAIQHKIDFLPEFFDGLLGEPGAYFENDGHLTAKGYKIFVKQLLPLVIRNIDILEANL